MCFNSGPISQIRSQMLCEKWFLIANQVKINHIIIEYCIDRMYRSLLSCECGSHFQYLVHLKATPISFHGEDLLKIIEHQYQESSGLQPTNGKNHSQNHILMYQAEVLY